MRTHSKGFTLIELMITVAIVAILAAIAYPSYMDSLKKTRRADAQTTLMGFVNAMERFYAQNNTFQGAAGSKATPLNSGSPWIFPSEAPLDGTPKFYDLKISASTATGFTLQATPKGAQTGDGMLEVDSLGTKIWYEKDDGKGAKKEW